MRWGIIGAGRIAKKVGAAMHTAPGHRITAVYGRRIDAAQVLAQEFSAVAFDDVGALLASQRCDAVYVALPNHLHAPITLQAIAAGLHVLVESRSRALPPRSRRYNRRHSRRVLWYARG